MRKFTSEVGSIRRHADLFLLANVKDPAVIRFESAHAAVMLQERVGAKVAPVLVVRDQNRGQFLSSAATLMTLGVSGLFLAWGDDLPSSSKRSNVRDFPDLASAVREVALVRGRTGSRAKLFAPVDLRTLGTPGGAKRARARLRAGADFLLAQPPTTDAGETFDRDSDSVIRAGLRGKVLLNAFPFRGGEDVRRYEGAFGWRLPAALHRAAARGEGGLISEAARVVRRLREEGFPGVYVTTRGEPALAERLLP